MASKIARRSKIWRVGLCCGSLEPGAAARTRYPRRRERGREPRPFLDATGRGPLTARRKKPNLARRRSNLKRRLSSRRSRASMRCFACGPGWARRFFLCSANWRCSRRAPMPFWLLFEESDLARTLLGCPPKSRQAPVDLTDFYTQLTASAALTDDELRPYLLALIGAGDAEHAHRLWVATLPPDQRPARGEVFNGRFEYAITGQPLIGRLLRFEARLPRWRNTEAAARPCVFSFTTHGCRFGTSQVLLLQPGAYRLTGQVRAEDLKNDRGLQWTLTCTTGRQGKARRNGARQRYALLD